MPKLDGAGPVYGPLDADLPVLIQSVKAQGFEGLVAKRRNSVYEPGLRSGAWMKMRVNRGQEFVIGGYTRGTKTFDALVFGYYEAKKSDLRRPHSQRLHTGDACAAVQEVQGARDRRHVRSSTCRRRGAGGGDRG